MPTPTKRSPKVEQTILDGLSKGETLTSICRADGMPDPVTVRRWTHEDEAFGIAYARARETGEDAIAERCFDIARETPATYATEHGERIDPGDIANRKLMIETDLKLLAKFNPKRWGDKIDLTSGGDKINLAAAIAEGNKRVADNTKDEQ